jgi:5'(3')-deoxyribonucleotidase
VRIGIDADNVLADFQGHWISLYEKWFQREVDPELATQWDCIVDGTHFENSSEFWAWAESVPEFWESMPAEPGAQGAVYELKRKGHELLVLTNRKDKASTPTKIWVLEQLPHGSITSIHHIPGDKSVVDCQLYIDDNPRRLVELAAKKPNVVIFDQPWNQEVETKPGLIRCKGWREVLEYVEFLSGPVEATS